MKKVTKLKKVIEYVVEGGWDRDGWSIDMTELMFEGEMFHQIIFSHKFAKAFFEPIPICEDCKTELKLMSIGDEIIKTWVCIKCSKSHRNPDYWWQYHIQKLALSTDRIQYLYDYIKGVCDEK